MGWGGLDKLCGDHVYDISWERQLAYPLALVILLSSLRCSFVVYFPLYLHLSLGILLLQFSFVPSVQRMPTLLRFF